VRRLLLLWLCVLLLPVVAAAQLTISSPGTVPGSLQDLGNSNAGFCATSTSAGTNAVNVVVICAGTAPTSSPTDVVQLWAADRDVTAGTMGLNIRTETGTQHIFADRVGLATLTPRESLEVAGQLAVSGAAARGLRTYGTGTDASTNLDLDISNISTATGNVRVFRTTNTSGALTLQILRGNNSTSVQHQFGSFGNSVLAALTGNVGIRTSTFGTNADAVFAVGSGTAPTTSPADAAQMWVADQNGVAGKAAWHLRDETGIIHTVGEFVGVNTTAPTHNLHVEGPSTGATPPVRFRHYRNADTFGSGFLLDVERSAAAGGAGLGVGILLRGETSTTLDQDMARIGAVWQTATHASRSAAGALMTVENASALMDREFFGAFKSVTNNTVTSMASMTLASNTTVATIVRYSCDVFDATDLQIEEGVISCHAINKGGVFSGNTCLKSSNQQAATSGTLTVTWTITAANPAVVSVNCNSSLTPSAGFPRVRFGLTNLTGQTVALN